MNSDYLGLTHPMNIMRKSSPLCTLSCLVVFVACTSNTPPPIAKSDTEQSAEARNVGTAPSAASSIAELDRYYRSPMLGHWNLVKEVYADSSGERLGENDFYTFRDDGTYDSKGVWNNDLRSGEWSINYASTSGGDTRCLLLAFDSKRLYAPPYWDYNMLSVALADSNGTQRLILTKLDDGGKFFFERGEQNTP